MRIFTRVSLVYVGLFLCFHSAFAQNLGARMNVEFKDIDGNVLPLALAGGLDNPQFSEADLNQDGLMDLVVFDKTGGAILTFVNNGISGTVDYEFRPELAKYFPKIEEWMLVRDYNGDGIPDIFASGTRQASAAIEVYKGRVESGTIRFDLIPNDTYSFDVLTFLNTAGNPLNVYVTGQDIPAIDDIDGDGDLDIVTFAISGGAVEYYQNQSVEMGFGLDSLLYTFEDKCWGRFYESGFGSTIELSTSIDTCAGSNSPVDGFWAGGTSHTSTRHSGSTVLTFDIDGDGDKEVVLGDISFSNFSMLTNNGDKFEAYMTAKDQSFPSNDTPVDLDFFPAGFYLDVNNDGAKDLLAAPNIEGVSENYNAAWYYKNTATNANPVFELQQRNFLIDEMIDFGSGANPVFADYNADGVMDLLVGSFGYRNDSGGYDARLFLFENQGTVSNPVFQLIDEDYLGYSQYGTRNFTPSFGDLDGDGDLDLLVGEEFGKLIYSENIAGAGNPFDFAAAVLSYASIDVGQFSTPQIKDVDGDELADLVIGERNGNLNFIKNIGDQGVPVFSADLNTAPNNAAWGMVDTRKPDFVTGSTSPHLLEVEEKLILLTGSDSGEIFLYDSIAHYLEAAFPLKDSDYSMVREGKISSPALYDINSDGFFDMLVGNKRGGFTIYQTDLPSGLTPIFTPQLPSLEASIFPNPNSGLVQINIPGSISEIYELKVFDLLGQLIQYKQISGGESRVQLGANSEGLYIIEIRGAQGIKTEKLIVKP